MKQIIEWLETAKGASKPEYNNRDNKKLCLSLNLEELSELAEAMGKDSLEDYIELLKDTTKKLEHKKNSKLKDTRSDIVDALVDMEWVKTNVLYFLGIPIEEYQAQFDKVTNANFTKFCHTEKEAMETVETYNQIGVGTYYQPTGNANYPFVVLRWSDNKIMKSINFVEPK